ncbi:MAG TPA: GNAT family N-acetyltransferase [Candidatus Eisenbacteria bacterium]
MSREAAPAFDPLVTLEGRHVRLEPLTREHRPDLARVAFEPDLWRWTLTRIDTPADLEAYIEAALALRQAGTAIPFATIDRSSGRAIGCTRFGNIDRPNRRVEIGWTWLGLECHRKAFNTEAKLLMLGHAFERMDCIRVEFRVIVANTRSRAAVARLGAKQEGILRHSQIAPDGRVLDWVHYSILREEGPHVRAGLEAKLAAHAPT